jgi:hypothetical protein
LSIGLLRKSYTPKKFQRERNLKKDFSGARSPEKLLGRDTWRRSFSVAEQTLLHCRDARSVTGSLPSNWVLFQPVGSQRKSARTDPPERSGRCPRHRSECGGGGGEGEDEEPGLTSFWAT